MYGVTHVFAVDGHSGKIVGFVTIPIKTAKSFTSNYCVSPPVSSCILISLGEHCKKYGVHRTLNKESRLCPNRDTS